MIERIGRWLFPETVERLDRLAAEYAAKLREAAGSQIDDDEHLWRRLSGSPDRDLTPMTQTRMQKTAAYLWEQNLLAERMVELPIAYLLAEGVKVVSKDEGVQEAVDQFWTDPINRLDLRFGDLLREYFVFGEGCWPAFTNAANGAVRIGYLDPCLIGEVVMDPDNPALPVGVVTVRDAKGRYRRYRVIYNGAEEEIFTERTRTVRAGFADGEAFLFQFKRLLSGTRGRSLLLASADWLDGYEQHLFGELDRALGQRTFMWDVTLKNATADVVADRAKKITAPRPNSLNIHNDSEEWKALSPSLQGADQAEFARLLRNHTLGGFTVPENWYGGAGDINRSTAESSTEPTLKVFSRYQKIVGAMLVETVTYAVGKRLGPKFNPRKPEQALNVEWPELMAKDISRYAAAIGQVAQGCAIAADRGWITDATAVSLIAQVAKRLGREIDAEQELAEARAERSQRREEEQAFPDPSKVPDAEDDPDARERKLRSVA